MQSMGNAQNKDEQKESTDAKERPLANVVPKIKPDFCDIYELYNDIQNGYGEIVIVDIRNESDFIESRIYDSVNASFEKLYIRQDSEETETKQNNSKNDAIAFANALRAIFFKVVKKRNIIEKMVFVPDINMALSDETQEREEFIANVQKFIQTDFKQYCKVFIVDQSFLEFRQKFPFLCFISSSNGQNSNTNNNNNTTQETTQQESKDTNELIEITIDVSMEEEKKRQRYKYPAQILNDKLFLGHWTHGNNMTILDHLQITHILNVTPLMSELDASDFKGMLQIELHDMETEDILGEMDKICEFIHGALTSHVDNKVLVHCQSGVSRSCTAVCAYLIKHRLMTASEAISFCVARRPIVEPNDGFIKQLKKYEKICQDSD